jgi:hypothetical protein
VAAPRRVGSLEPEEVSASVGSRHSGSGTAAPDALDAAESRL